MAVAVSIHHLLSGVAVAAGAHDDADTPAILDSVCVATQTTNSETFDVSFVTTLKMIYQCLTRSGFGTTGSGEGNNDNMFRLRQCMSYVSIRLSPWTANSTTPRRRDA
jgi:hypothetical protein